MTPTCLACHWGTLEPHALTSRWNPEKPDLRLTRDYTRDWPPPLGLRGGTKHTCSVGISETGGSWPEASSPTQDEGVTSQVWQGRGMQTRVPTSHC